MAEETKIEATEVQKKTRRQFVKTSAQVAVTAPAVAMLLSATTKPAMAKLYGIGNGTGNTGNAHDDPNKNEDIDFVHTGATNQTIDDGP